MINKIRLCCYDHHHLYHLLCHILFINNTSIIIITSHIMCQLLLCICNHINHDLDEYYNDNDDVVDDTIIDL